jgi:hypothetical protein
LDIFLGNHIINHKKVCPLIVRDVFSNFLFNFFLQHSVQTKLFVEMEKYSVVLNLMIIKLSSMIFILVLQNCPIRTNDLFDTVFWLAVFIEYKYKLVLKRFMTINGLT